MGCAGAWFPAQTDEYDDPKTGEHVVIRRLSGLGIICGAGIAACWHCGMVADYLCDWPVGRRKRCDQPLCERHRVQQGETSGLDYCPAHALAAAGLVTLAGENGAGVNSPAQE